MISNKSFFEDCFMILIGVTLFYFAVAGVRTGEMSFGTANRAKRSDNPGLFWFYVIGTVLLAIVSLIGAVEELTGSSHG